MIYGAHYRNSDGVVLDRGPMPVAVPRNHTAFVTAIVVTRRRSPYLAAALRAVQSQTRPPDQILVVDADAPRGASPQLGLQLGAAHFIAAGRLKSFGAAVSAGLRAIPSTGWAWLMHDDSTPQPDALAHLLRATEHSDAIGVAGCKQRRWDVSATGEPLAPGRPGAQLLSVGHTVSNRGQRLTGIEPGEIDQGQHDGRQDVLAVSLAGALVKVDLWQRLEGTDPLYGHFGDSTDFCCRARRAGARVVVVPSAVVYHAQASLLGLRHQVRIRHSAPGAAQQIAISQGHLGYAPSHQAPLRGTTESGVIAYSDRTSTESYPRRRFSEEAGHLANLAVLKYPMAFLWLFLKMPFRVAARLLAKNPTEAGQELILPARLTRHLPAIHQARRRLIRTTNLPRAVTRPLMADWRELNRAKRDSRLAAQELSLTRSEAPIGGPDEVAPRLRRTRLGFGLMLVLLITATTFIGAPWFGDLLAGSRITGGALLAAPASLSETWRSATAIGFSPGPSVPDPFLLIFAALAMLTRSGQAAVHLLLLGAVPLAGISAWFGYGEITRSHQKRFAAALIWGLAPPLLTALTSGYLAGIVVHQLLPLALLALVRALKTKQLGALAAAGLLFAVLIAASPVLLLVAVLVTAGIAAFAKGRRWYGFAAIVPALGLGAPFWVFVFRMMVEQPSQVWQLLLAQPLALPASGPIEISNWSSWLWPTPLVSFVLLLLGYLALTGLPVAEASTLDSSQVGSKRVGIVIAAFVCSVAISGFGYWASQNVSDHQVGALSPTPAPVPAAAQLLETGYGEGALLHLSGNPGQVDYSLLRHNGSALTDLSVTAHIVSSVESDTSENQLQTAVGALLAGNDHAVTAQLAGLGVVGVIVPSNNMELASQIDSQAGLVRVTEGDGVAALWRVESPAPTGQATHSGSAPVGGTGLERTVWLIVVSIVFGVYLLVAIPNPRNLINRRYGFAGTNVAGAIADNSLRGAGSLMAATRPQASRRVLVGVRQAVTGLAAVALVGGLAYFGPNLAARVPAGNLALGPAVNIASQIAATGLVCPDRIVPNSGTATNLLGEPVAAGATASWLDEGEQRGLALASCAAPSADLWLLGGTSNPGDTSTLRFFNSGARPASVSLEVFGLTGQLALGSRGVIPVAPGDTVTVPLDAIAPDQPRLAVHATATGSVIAASMATTSLAGTVANGVELVDHTAAPDFNLIIPALRSDGQEIGEATAPAVRLLSASADATAQVSVIGNGGPITVPGLGPITLAAGVPTDVSLGGIEPGEYSVIVTADQPIVGAGRWARATGDAHDVAWVPSIAAAPQSSAVMPAGMVATVVITAPLDAPALITGTISGRIEESFELTPDSVLLLEVPFDITPSLLTVAADAPVAWGLTVQAAHDPGLISGIAATPFTAATSGTITVRETYVR